jgi:DNA-binding transcriptional LysR family regulator
MTKLPDLEALAIFAKVAESRSFAGAAAELELSKATVSKAVSRLESRLGTRLFNRTSRRLALTQAGGELFPRAVRIVADAEEGEALAQAAAPRGTVRLTAPMTFGLLRVAPLLPDFLKSFPDITVDLHLSDAMVDIVGQGFDAALRIAALPDSSLVAQRLCAVQNLLVAAPAYLARHGTPKHPLALAEHNCLGYAYLLTSDTWHFSRAGGETASVRPKGSLKANNGDALLPSVEAGLGIALLPDFIVRNAIAGKRLTIVLPEWSATASALHWVTPPGRPRPARIEALGRFFSERLALAPPQVT